MQDKILIVDDDDLILSCFGRVLGRRFNIETALGPSQGLEALTHRGPYAVVVSDMRMPGMTGIALLARAKELSPATVRILFTGDADVVEVEDAIRQGIVFGFIQKPCTPLDLDRALEEALVQHHQNVEAVDR